MNDVGGGTHQTNSNKSNEDQVSLLVAETPKGGDTVEEILDEDAKDLQEIDP